jgi:hypothetical protein
LIEILVNLMMIGSADCCPKPGSTKVREKWVLRQTLLFRGTQSFDRAPVATFDIRIDALKQFSLLIDLRALNAACEADCDCGKAAAEAGGCGSVQRHSRIEGYIIVSATLWRDRRVAQAGTECC